VRDSICMVLILASGALVAGCGGGGSSGGSPPPTTASGASPAGVGTHTFTDPASCQSCHPLQYREWEGSVMHYGAASPVFNAFELTINKLSVGAVADNGVNANFCIECHSPPAPIQGETQPFFDAASARPSFESLSEVSKQGVSCDVCHSATAPDYPGSLLNDGIANRSLLLDPEAPAQGPLANAASNAFHDSAENPFLSSSEFCGSCHDVRLPRPDPVTGEPFQRLENLFSEWQSGPYNSPNNPHGRVVSCQDCHMSLYPQSPPGTYPQSPVAIDPDTGASLPPRRHALHAFTAVSTPLVDDPRFPNVSTRADDGFGFPLGQQQRRRQLLEATCELSLGGTPDFLPATASVIPLRVTVTNTGAGHKVPSGFSQERQVWLEVIVEDDAGVIYESGVLHDSPHPETGETAPDGRLDDEDLEDLHFDVDLDTFDTHVSDGPDVDQRPRGVNLGLANFQNRFVRILPDGSWEPVLNPMLADHMDNSHSLDMLAPRVVPYDVPVPARGLVGDVRVSVRLRYRAFPPEFLRFLAQREPGLVTEEIVDRNRIVDMVDAFQKIRLTDQ